MNGIGERMRNEAERRGGGEKLNLQLCRGMERLVEAERERLREIKKQGGGGKKMQIEILACAFLRSSIYGSD